ncbi:MAG: HigA family addiction module antidote protein [Hyphomicrobiales bacterium]|nr:HigA family addiction module antidote protein [Hyphomicrobiales bacterium]MBV8429154.1 HigA family addiction module antidote protein [Hyphomicrobiales bacterium]MBV9434135.1 HigA family addiction module antidote protein [Hyphomicrobiales bacterium]MBW0002026.1 HigA family addiction module antidote protein [Hyphomicrobiales bacterium]
MLTMKTPPHPGEMIGDSLEEMGVTVVDAAKALGVTRQQLHNVIAGRSAIVPEMAYRLEKVLGSTADAWLRLQAAHELAQVRARASQIKVGKLRRKVA